MSPAAGRACSRHYVEEPRHFQDASHEDHDDPRIEPIVECLSCRPVPGCGNRRHRRIHRRRVHFGLMTMRLPTDSVAISLATAGTSDALYRVAFVGGPFDGHMARWGTLPRMCLDLASGPADCGTRVGSTTVRRAARYRWTSTRLVSLKGAPVVIMRYEYHGTARQDAAPRAPLWRRSLAALRRWWMTIECPVGPIAMNATTRNKSHV